MKDLKSIFTDNNHNGNKFALLSAVCFAVYVLAGLLPFLNTARLNDALITGTCILEEVSMTALAVTVFLRNKKAAAIAAGGYALSVLLFFVINLACGFFDHLRLVILLAYAALVFTVVRSAEGNKPVRRIWFLAGAVCTVSVVLYPVEYSWKAVLDDWFCCLSRIVFPAAALFIAGLWLKADPAGLKSKDDPEHGERIRRENRIITGIVAASLLVFLALVPVSRLLPAEEEPASLTDPAPAAVLPMPAEAEPFTGSWACDGTTLDISWNEDCFSVHIIRSSSALENSEWLYRCQYRAENGTLAADASGTRIDYVHRDDGGLVSSTERYSGGSAVFLLDRDGNLIWRDDREGAGAGMRFERMTAAE